MKVVEEAVQLSTTTGQPQDSPTASNNLFQTPTVDNKSKPNGFYQLGCGASC